MCILAGCDFLKALNSIGIKKAHGHIRKLKTFVRVGACAWLLHCIWQQP